MGLEFMKRIKWGLSVAVLAAVLLLVPINRLFAAGGETPELAAYPQASAEIAEQAEPESPRADAVSAAEPAVSAAEPAVSAAALAGSADDALSEYPTVSEPVPHPEPSESAEPAAPGQPEPTDPSVPSKPADVANPADPGNPAVSDPAEPSAPAPTDPPSNAAEPAEPAEPTDSPVPVTPAKPVVSQQADPAPSVQNGDVQALGRPAPVRPADPGVRSTADPAVKARFNRPAVSPAVAPKPTAKSASKPTSKPTAKSASKPTPKPTAKSASKPTPKPTAKSIQKPASKPNAKSASKPPAAAAQRAGSFSVGSFQVKKLSNERVQLIWTAAPGATHYRVMRRDRTGSAFKWQASVTGLYFTDQKPLAGVNTYYVYPIRKINGQVTVGKTSPARAIAVAPPPVTGLNTRVSDRRVTLTWKASRGANLYRIFRRTALSGGKMVLLRNTTALSCLDQNPVGGWQYYTVRPAYHAGKQLITGAAAPVRAALVAPGPVGSLKARGTAVGTALLSWQKAPGATHYLIYRRHQQDSQMLYVGYATGTGWQDAKPAPGINDYTVVPSTKNGKSYVRLPLARQPRVSAAVRPKPIQTLKVGHDGRWNLHLSWNARTGISRYQIFFKEDGAHDFVHLASTDKMVYLDRLLLPGRHRYSIRAVARVAGKDYISADGNYVYATIAAPRNDADNPEVFTSADDFMHYQILMIERRAPLIHGAYEFKSTPAMAQSTLNDMLQSMNRIFTSKAFFRIKSGAELESIKRFNYVYRPVSENGGIYTYRAVISATTAYHSTDAAFRQAEATAASVARSAMGQTGWYNRVKYVFDWIAQNTDYAYKSNVYRRSDGTVNPDFWSGWRSYNSKGNPVYSAAAVANDHEAVCQGYASFMINTLQRMGIKTHYAVSNADRHAWLMARLNGRWYHVEPTWGDQYGRNANDPHNWINPEDRNSGVKRRMNYDYLLVSDAKINAKGGHTLYSHFPRASQNYIK